MTDCPLTNEGYTFTNKIGANELQNPANQISEDLSLSLAQSHEGLEGLRRPGDWV